MELKIEGDCAQINEKQLEFIKCVIDKRGFKNNNVIIGPLGKVGDNYLANLKRITVEDENGDDFKMVAKIAPQNETERKFCVTEPAFFNEHIVYTKILPKYTELEKTHNVPPQDRLRYPICYGSFNEAPNEVIILEDLNESNFKMLNRFESLRNDCVKSIIKDCALLHSLGFALNYKEPDVFNEFRSSLFDIWSNFDNMEGAEVLFKGMEINLNSVLETDYYKNATLGALRDTFLNCRTIPMSDDSKHWIIQHGDAWINNFMFQIDGDQVTQSILIDYETCKAANPVADLLFMISTCTDYESRKEFYYEWIDYYYSELDKALSYYGLKSNFVYPRDQLDVDLKQHGKVILGHTIYMVGMIVLKPEEATVMQKARQRAMQEADLENIVNHSGAASSKDPETVAIFRKKIEDLVDSYYELGLL